MVIFVFASRPVEDVDDVITNEKTDEKEVEIKAKPSISTGK